jgi:hypothetical protein
MTDKDGVEMAVAAHQHHIVPLTDASKTAKSKIVENFSLAPSSHCPELEGVLSVLNLQLLACSKLNSRSPTEQMLLQGINLKIISEVALELRI